MLEQSSTAKCLPGQVLLNWLTAAADGHGGISDISKLATSGLVDTFRITLADKTTFDIPVTNGRSISGVDKVGTDGLVDTYAISYNDETTSYFTIKNGEKGDKGDNYYTWIKYASQEPTVESHSMGDLPDDWKGEYNGPLAEAPTDWKQYRWYKIKGEQGDKGDPATLMSTEIVYQSSDSGTIIPSGEWSASIPVVPQGKYLWTREVTKFNTGDPITKYSVSRMGMDGSGSVSSVCDVPPDSDGNVALSPADVGALPSTGGDLTGELRMNGQHISGLNDPTEDTQAARKGYVDNTVSKAAPHNLLDNSDFTKLVAQAGIGGSHGAQAYAADRWILTSGTVSYTAGAGLTLNGTITQKLENAPDAAYPYVGIVSGTASINYADGAVTITSGGGVLKWAALYEDAYTADTLPEYQPKGYGAELLECQRYFVKVFDNPGGPAEGFGFSSSSATVRITVPLPIAMRTNPSVSFVDDQTVSDVKLICNGTFVIPAAISYVSIYNNTIHIQFTVSDVTANHTYVMRSLQAYFSADL